ncbi:CD276 antigen homolog [Lepisosteus oculatus]|uniref:CD276 antigen homolog n=1 Tax=Lepisosteus oculatus TaxID=7918 RepID=UPI0035F52615
MKMSRSNYEMWKGFLVLLSAFITACSNTSQLGIIGEDVMLPCNCEMEENIEYLVWQIGEHRVVDAFIKGKRNQDEQDEEFRNRTKLFFKEKKGNCSLQMSLVSIADEHIYTCIYETSSVNQVHVSLQVAANYSRPDLQLLSEPKIEGVAKTYTCTTKGGYPMGKIHWLLNNQALNVTMDARHDTDLRDNITGCYNLSSSLTLKLFKSDVLSCSVENPRLQVNLTSSISSPFWNPPPEIKSITISTAVGCIGVALFVVGIWLLIKLQKQCSRRQQNDNKVEAQPLQNQIP